MSFPVESHTSVFYNFLRHAEKAAGLYGLEARDVLLEVGRRKLVSGQEDMILDIAVDLSRARGEVTTEK